MALHGTTKQIRDFIVAHVEDHPGDISQVVAAHFGISRQAVARHLRALTASGILDWAGHTRARRYSLHELARFDKHYPITPGLAEHIPWAEDVKPLLSDLPKNVLEICGYGFTEMLNNAIDHSQGRSVSVKVRRNAATVEMSVFDNGMGIFRKIRDQLGLHDEMEAIIELTKGKLTTDPAHHSGEGIFFTSRLFDFFSMLSGSLYFSHSVPDDDWLLEDRASTQPPGTLVVMRIALNSARTQKEVFDLYASEDNDYSFSKTHVPVKLLEYGTENLVSRSQAKRLLARFEKFKEVILNFTDVESIGQAFADEVFRVFVNEHPETRLTFYGANERVRSMIARAASQTDRSGSAPGPATPPTF